MPKAADNSEQEYSSALSRTIQNLDPNDFYVRPVEKTDSSYVKTKIYFFNSPSCLEIEISQNDLTKDVIRHIMTLYRKSPYQQKQPLEFP
jgi:hypothetical protein